MDSTLMQALIWLSAGAVLSILLIRRRRRKVLR
jgi:hypothetical protein